MAERWANVGAQPPKISPSNLYCISRLADYAVIVKHVLDSYNATIPVYCLGGSYGGFLSAVLRYHYLPFPSQTINLQPSSWSIGWSMATYFGAVWLLLRLSWREQLTLRFGLNWYPIPLSIMVWIHLYHTCVLTTILSSQIRVVRRRFAAVSRRWQI